MADWLPPTILCLASYEKGVPFDVFHQGGVALTRMLPRDAADHAALLELNERVLQALGAADGATHMEFIKAHHDGTFYFLEVAARVGGACISDMIEAASGLNLWHEWARIETAPPGHAYQVPVHRDDCAGVLISLARMEHPDTSAYREPEIVWRLDKPHHVGFIVTSPDAGRVWSLLDDLTRRVSEDFGAAMPPYTAKPPSTL